MPPENLNMTANLEPNFVQFIHNGEDHSSEAIWLGCRETSQNRSKHTASGKNLAFVPFPTLQLLNENF